MSYEFKLTDIIPATPQAVYDAWLSSRGHSAMTGGTAKMSAKVGGAFTAWAGYISGKNISLVPGERIVQSWRTTEFTTKEGDSKISVTLKAVKGGTKITLKHSNVPDAHTSYENGGWQTHYFEPMKKYFAKKKKKSAVARPRKRR
jgi:uncharacterized protein YndB with AHSA1/START domain